MNSPRPFAPRTEHVVGRTQEINAMNTALAEGREPSDLLYFVGPGGIGKTRLLEEAAQRADSLARVLPLFDLYHADLHSVAGIEDAIVTGLDPEGHHFIAYREKREALEGRRVEGVKISAEEQQALTATLVEEYNALAAEKRILLRFDTTELIQRESDRVQELSDIETEYIEVRHWLLTVLPRLRNSVILLAGRPPAPLLEALGDRCQGLEGIVFQSFTLGGLSWQAAREYLDELVRREPRLSEIPDDVWRRAWEYTAGHPIRLSLMVDLVLHGRDIASLFPFGVRAESKPPTEEDIDRYLVEELLSLPVPIRIMLHYLTLARKGLDLGLLHDMEPNWAPRECHERLYAMRKFTFVKVHEGTGRLFAHDELYAVFDRFVLQDREAYRGTYQKMRDYYARLMGQSQPSDSLKTDRLYYELQVDPWEGFWRYYVPWAEEAVRAGDADLDMRLRDELLHFLRDKQEDGRVAERLPRHLVDADAAVRWMRRYLDQADVQRTVKIAKRVEERDFLAGAPLYRAAAAIVHAEAVLYTGEEDEGWVESKLHGAIERLGKSKPAEGDPRSWWHTRLLGRAYNNLGYHYWLQGRNEDAILEFRRAIWAFRKAKIRDEMADTLTNLGFVYAQQGVEVEAETTLLDAVGLREGGPQLPLAYSLNTLGLAYTLADYPERGAVQSAKALDIFKGLEHARGEGLSHLALGLTYRKIGEEWKGRLRTPQEAEDAFHIALRHLTAARTKFAGVVDEPLRLWEAYNELGSLHLDWGWLLTQEGGDEKAGEAEGHYRQAVENLEKSVKAAQEHGLIRQMVDSYDDLSQLYADRGSVGKTEAYVGKILDMIPREYHLTEGGFQEIAHPVEEWWLLLGKLHFGRAVRHVKKAVDLEAEGEKLDSAEKDQALSQAGEDYAHAMSYFQRYSPHSAHLPRTLRSIQSRVKTLSAERIERMYERIQGFSESHGVDLDRLLHLLENTLGIELGEPL